MNPLFLLGALVAGVYFFGTTRRLPPIAVAVPVVTPPAQQQADGYTYRDYGPATVPGIDIGPTGEILGTVVTSGKTTGGGGFDVTYDPNGGNSTAGFWWH